MAPSVQGCQLCGPLLGPGHAMDCSHQLMLVPMISLWVQMSCNAYPRLCEIADDRVSIVMARPPRRLLASLQCHCRRRRRWVNFGRAGHRSGLHAYELGRKTWINNAKDDRGREAMRGEGGEERGLDRERVWR